MSGVHARQADTDVLHPAVRDRMKAVRDALHAEGYPFEIFEAFRTPQRQADLYAQGRTAPGRVVTKAPPWSSYHQYGLACDFVLFNNGQWSWDDKGANAAAWKRLEVIGRQNGLEPLSFERPHLQLAGIDIADLRAGRYPPGCDLVWAETVATAISSWSGGGAPPIPAEAFGRPEIRGAAVAPVPIAAHPQSEPEGLSRPAVPQPELHMPTPARTSTVFPRIQAQVDKWEGGWVDDPRDPGGATNRGITLRTLSAWRQRPASKDELKALTLAETWQIMKANYYDVVCGDELPPAVAALAHNAAVLHGPKRSATFLQTVLVRAGQGIDVDGAVGRDTLAAARAVAAGAVCDGFLREEEAYLRSLARFDVYGKGWLNRLNDFRAFAGRLLQDGAQVVAPVASADAIMPGEVQRQPDLSRAADATPSLGGTPSPSGTTLIDLMARANDLINLIAGRQAAKGGAVAAPDDPADRLAMIARLIHGLAGQVTGDPRVLTPVNAAFGTTLGKLLNGRKTGIGAAGTLITVLLPQLEKLIPALSSLSGVIAGAVPVLQPIFIALTLWGLLGKAEKWVTLPPPVLKS